MGPNHKVLFFLFYWGLKRSMKITINCFNFIHVPISPSLTKTMINASLSFEIMLHRRIAIGYSTELKKFWCKYPNIALLQSLHWRNCNSKKSCRILQIATLAQGQFLWKSTYDVNLLRVILILVYVSFPCLRWRIFVFVNLLGEFDQ